jgi:excisionase family DNA binding protein
MIERDFYTPKEIADALRISISTVYRMMQRGRLKHSHTTTFKTHHSCRIPKSELERLKSCMES